MASQASLSLVQSLYVAYYGRPADPDGLNFWATLVDNNNGSTSSILHDFGNSAEFLARFGSLTNEQLVNNLYHQLFSRDAETEGRDFWVGVLARGDKTLAEIADTIRGSATGIDKQVLDARVQLADAFTGQLDSQAELEAYGTTRGIGIGRDYLDQVTASNAANPPVGQAPDVVATLIPSNGGGGGGGGTPAPTFGISDVADVLTFTGTATGAITVTLSGSTVTYTRDGLTATQTKAAFDALTDLQQGSATLTIAATLVTGHTVSGTGTLNVTGVTQTTDLSNLSAGLTLHLTTAGNVDLTDPAFLAPGVASYSVTTATGNVLTLDVAQKAQVTIDGTGTYELKDTAAHLTAATTATQNGAAKIIVTDAATIAELTTLDAATGTLEYTTVKGTAAALQADAASNSGAGTFVTAGKNALVTDSSSVAQLDAVQTAIATGTVYAENISDTVAHLVSGSTANHFITVGSNVTVTDSATVAAITTLDTANGLGAASGTLTYSLNDTLVAVLAADPALVTGATTVTLTAGTNLGNVTVAQLNQVLGWSNLTGVSSYTDLTYSLIDTPSNLLSAATGYVSHATAVTATDQSSLGQAIAIYDLKATAIYSITASASSLADTSVTHNNDVINHAVDITASNAATVAEGTAILARTNTGDTNYNLSDSYSALNGGGATVNAAHDVTVNSGQLTAAQAQNIVNFTNDGLTQLGWVQDTAAAINTFVGANAWAAASLTYTFYVSDSAANIISALGNLTFVTGNSAEGSHEVQQIYVNDAFTVATSKQFWEAVKPQFDAISASLPNKTSYFVTDTVANYITDETNFPGYSSWLTDADGKTVTGSAADISNAEAAGKVIFNHLTTGNDHILTTAGGSAGTQNLYGKAGYDFLDGGADNDYIDGGAGDDTIIGGAGFNTLLGGDGRDTIYAGTNSGADTNAGGLSSIYSTSVTGGVGGDNMFGSTNKDVFVYTATDRAGLIAEAGTSVLARDYITNFASGDTIQFSNFANLQFLGNGSANASSVEAGTFGLSIRYEKNVNATLWDNATQATATKVSIDIAKADGTFDNIADATIILVGNNIDIHAEGNTIVFGA